MEPTHAGEMHETCLGRLDPTSWLSFSGVASTFVLSTSGSSCFFRLPTSGPQLPYSIPQCSQPSTRLSLNTTLQTPPKPSPSPPPVMEQRPNRIFHATSDTTVIPDVDAHLRRLASNERSLVVGVHGYAEGTKPHAKCAVGVYFGLDSSWNISAPIPQGYAEDSQVCEELNLRAARGG